MVVSSGIRRRIQYTEHDISIIKRDSGTYNFEMVWTLSLFAGYSVTDNITPPPRKPLSFLYIEYACGRISWSTMESDSQVSEQLYTIE